MIRSRHQAPYRGLGIDIADDPNAVDYYAILDLEILGARRYGRGFVDWLLANKNPLEILFRLADETGVVLLPGKGFGTPHPSARVSLANLDEPRLYQNRRHRSVDYGGIRQRVLPKPTTQVPSNRSTARQLRQSLVKIFALKIDPHQSHP